MFTYLGKITNYRQYDKSVFAYLFALGIGNFIFNSSRPQNSIAQIVFISIAIFIVYLIVNTKFTYQIILALSFSFEQALIILLNTQLFTAQALFTAFLSLLFANLIAAVGAWQLHSYRQGLFIYVNERKKAENALKESEQLYRTLFENTEDGFSLIEPIFDQNGTCIDYWFIKVNQSWEKQSGLRAADFVGKRMSEAMPSVEPSWAKFYGDVRKSGKAQRIENFNQASNRWHDTYAFPYKEKQVGILFRDITERKQAEESLAKAKEQSELDRRRLETVLETIPVAVVIAEAPSSKFSYINKRARELYGFDSSGLTLEENVAKVKPKKLDGTPYPAEELPVYLALHGQTILNRELMLERPDGTSYPIYGSSAPIVDAKGKIIAAVVIFEDITERKQAQEELANVASFPTLNPNPIVEADFEGNISYLNPVAKTRLTDIEALGSTHPFLANWQSVVKAFEGKTTGTFTREIKVGEHWYHQQVYLVPNSQSIRIYSANIDKRKRAEEELLQAQAKLQEYTKNLEQLVEERTKQLRESERMATIGQTVGMVGHDIRNPLQSVVGDLYLLKSDIESLQDGENKQSALETIIAINDNINYINKIVADLQDYARQTAPQLEEVDLEDLVNKAFATITIPDNIQADCYVEPNTKIRADSSYIRRIITNLTTNAIQAMPNGGKLSVKAIRKDNDKTIQITVADTGEGIPKGIQDKLFKPLFTTKSKGQGFGLAVVKKFAEELGGTIRFESQEGKGTSFIVSLPKEAKNTKLAV